MKNIYFLLSLAVFTSCGKDKDAAIHASGPISSSVPATVFVSGQDSIPDGGVLKVRLQQDSSVLDETMLIFNHAADSRYNSSDAVYFAGFGKASLASLTKDSVACAINNIPYASGMSVRLKVNAKNDGVYQLKISYLRSIPPSVNIWLKDAYRRDSLAIRYWNYKFDVIKNDSNSYGSHRFTLVFR